MLIFVTMWKKWEHIKKAYLALKLNEVIDYEKFSMISMVYHSTKIEGCSLSENDTRFLLENDITAQGKPLSDHLMVKDHFAALIYLKEEAQKKRKISLELIQETAALVMKNTGGPVSAMGGGFDTSKGELRTAQVYVEQKYFPNYQKVEALLLALIEKVNSKLDEVKGAELLKLAADFHYSLVNIHPFGDGNGRTARLLMNYIVLYHDEPLLKIFTEDRADYIDALNQTEAKEDPDIFRNFVVQQQIKFFESEIARYQQKDKGFRFLF